MSYSKGNAAIKAEIHSPANQASMGTKTTTTSWDNGTEFSITANSHFVFVWLDEDTHIICDSSTGDPSGAADNACIFRGGDTHKIPCRGQTKLHFKGVTAGGKINVNAYHD